MTTSHDDTRVAKVLTGVISWGLLGSAVLFAWALWKCLGVILADRSRTDLVPFGVLAVLLVIIAPVAAVAGVRMCRQRSMLAEATMIRLHAFAAVGVAVICVVVLGVIAIAATVGVSPG